MTLRIYGLRPYLRLDGKATGNGWRISAGFDARLSEVLTRIIDMAMRSAETREVQTLRAVDLEPVGNVLDVVARIDPGIPRSIDTAGRQIPRSTSNVRSNARTANDESAIPEDSSK